MEVIIIGVYLVHPYIDIVIVGVYKSLCRGFECHYKGVMTKKTMFSPL